jgi:hypothetical protein
VIRTQKALESFFTHKATLGTDFAVVAGPFGIGATAEAGMLFLLPCASLWLIVTRSPNFIFPLNRLGTGSSV